MTINEADGVVNAIHPRQKYAEWLEQKERILIDKYVNTDDLTEQESLELLDEIAVIQAEMMAVS